MQAQTQRGHSYYPSGEYAQTAEQVRLFDSEQRKGKLDLDWFCRSNLFALTLSTSRLEKLGALCWRQGVGSTQGGLQVNPLSILINGSILHQQFPWKSITVLLETRGEAFPMIWQGAGHIGKERCFHTVTSMRCVLPPPCVISIA